MGSKNPLSLSSALGKGCQHLGAQKASSSTSLRADPVPSLPVLCQSPRDFLIFREKSVRQSILVFIPFPRKEKLTTYLYLFKLILNKI